MYKRQEEGAEEAGLLPYEIITQIDGVRISGNSEFSDRMGFLSSGDEATFTVLSQPDSSGERSARDLAVTMGDRFQYYIELCEGDALCVEETEVLLAELGIEHGDAFLGVSNLRSSSSGVDYYSGILSGDYNLRQAALGTAVSPLLMIGVPIQYDGQTMLLEERAMLEAGDLSLIHI